VLVAPFLLKIAPIASMPAIYTTIVTMIIICADVIRFSISPRREAHFLFHPRIYGKTPGQLRIIAYEKAE
jgi:hypothetical protein